MSRIFDQLDTTLSQQREHARVHTNELQEAMTQLLSRLEGSSAESMASFQSQVRQVLAQTAHWSSQMEGRLQAVSGTLAEGSRQQREEMQAHVQGLSETVSNLVAHLAKSAHSQQQGLSQQMESLLSQVHANTQAQSEQLQAQHQQILGESDTWLNQVRTFLESLLERQQTLSQALSSTGATLMTSGRDFEKALAAHAGAAREMQAMVSTLQASATQLKQATQETANVQAQLHGAIERVGVLANRYGELLQEIERLPNAQKQVYEALEQSLGRVLSEVHQSLKDYTETCATGITSFNKAFDEQMKSAMSRLEETISTMDDQLTELTDMLSAKLQTKAPASIVGMQ